MIKNLCLLTLLTIGAYFPSKLDAKLYFIHIPKTGGTTLRLMLELQVSGEEIYPFRNEFTAKGPAIQDLVSGHFPYWFCKTLDNSFEEAFKITVLRDPVERYLSFLRARKKGDHSFPDLESVISLYGSPTKKYHYGLMDNSLCRHLAASPLLEGQDLLNSAKDTLLTLDHVLFFDSFTEDVLYLFECLGIDLSTADVPKINVTEKEPISKELEQKIIALNKLDIELYEWAKTHLQKSNAQYRLRTRSFDKILEKTSALDYSFNLPLNGRGWNYRQVMQNTTGKYATYRWVMNKPAYIYFPLEEGFDYDLYFNAQPLTNEVVPRVSINGQEIEVFKLDGEQFATYHGKIPKGCITDQPTEISFYASESFLYRDIHPSKYNRNHPPLSFAVNRIQVSKKD